MKTKFSFLLLSSVIVSLFIGTFLFAVKSNAGNTTTHKSLSVKENDKQDGEIIATLIVLNKNEIALAKEALIKVRNPAVRKYAHLLKREHTKNLNQTLKLSKKTDINPVETATVITLKQDGEKELLALSSLKAKSFEEAYVNAMVKEHTAALNLIDDNLLINVTNPALKAQIEATRPHIASHLEKAKELQNELKVASAN